MSFGWGLTGVAALALGGLWMRERTARRQAEAALATRPGPSRFLARVSHELRTPLNSLLILAGILAENRGRRLNTEEVEYARTIHNAGADLLALIDDLLDLARVESDEMSIESLPVRLGELAARLRGVHGPVARDRGLTLEIDIDDELPPAVSSDPTRLTQILDNLVSNALKFTHEGGIEIAFRSVAGALQVTVADSGIGIPEDRQAAVFEAFQQVDRSTTRQYGGTGLGLAISRQIAERLGGRLDVSSTLGSGSTFTLVLPLAAASVVPPRPSQSVAPLETPEVLPQPVLVDRVALVAHSDIRVLFALAGLLETLGMEVCPAESVAAAAEYLASRQFDVAVVAADLDIPRDGTPLVRVPVGDAYPARLGELVDEVAARLAS